jgi:hypothetical protein
MTPMDKPTTKKQHFIPQVYLRGFSPDYILLGKSRTEPSKFTIYQHEIGVTDQIDRTVPVKSICYQDYLYETPDKNGEYVNPNWLEKAFNALEQMFASYREKLEKKAFHEENYKIMHFLDSDERAFWITYIALQVLRLPELLDEAAKETKRLVGNENISEVDINAFVRMYCLPLFSEIKENSKEALVFNSIIKPMFSMNFAIGVDLENKLITSDKTVYIYTPKYPCDEYEEVVFPITSSICLVLLGGDKKEKYKNNILFPIDGKTREYICGCIASTAFKRVYSNHFLSDREIRIIEQSREEVV